MVIDFLKEFSAKIDFSFHAQVVLHQIKSVNACICFNDILSTNYQYKCMFVPMEPETSMSLQESWNLLLEWYKAW